MTKGVLSGKFVTGIGARGHDECVSREITDYSATGCPFSRHARASYCFSKSAYHSPAAMIAFPGAAARIATYNLRKLLENAYRPASPRY